MKNYIQAELHATEISQLERERDKQVAFLNAKLAKESMRRRLAEKELLEAEVMAGFRQGISGDGGQAHPPYKHREPSGKATAVIALNDWHGEERVDPLTINGLNEYSLEIAEKRLAIVGRNALRLINSRRSLSNIRDLVVWIGGDIITGHIHEELAENSPLSPTEACRWAKFQLIGLIDHWQNEGDFDSITVVTSYGNHGRTTAKPRIATAAKHSFEWGMYHSLADVYAARGEKNIQFKVEQSYHNWLTIQGKRVRFHHGDWLKYQGGVGGLTIPVNKAINEWNKSEKADYEMFGHWHQHLKHRRWCACNCLIGYNAYALSIKAEFSEPSQTLVVFDRDRPLPVSVDEIYCDESAEEKYRPRRKKRC